MSSFSEPKSESSIRLEIGKPFGVGLGSTEGERVLKALRQIQHKLNLQKSYSADLMTSNKKTTTESSVSTSGDHYLNNKSNKCTNTSIVKNNYNKYCEDLIETRLQLIEKQLHNIVELMTFNNTLLNSNNNPKPTQNLSPNINNPYPTPSPSTTSATEEQIGLNLRCGDTCIHINSNKLNSNDITISKSKSCEAINKSIPSKHFHLQYKDIPFLLGTNSSKSHSEIAKRQIEISKLKQHNHLCEQKPTRNILNEKIRDNALDHEIKELLYDLQEEHNYICEEIQHLTKHLESVTDEDKRAHFKRELYFLSRRILAKKKQINELQELHSILMKNAYKKQESVHPHIVGKPSKRRVMSKSVSTQYLPKWV